MGALAAVPAPASPTWTSNLQHVLGGYELGDLRPDFLDALARIDPSSFPLLKAHVSALQDAGRLAEARAALERFAAANPGLPSGDAAALARLLERTELLERLRGE